MFPVHQIESYVKINGGDLTELSVQQLTSCTPNPLKCGGTGGCLGSIPQLAYSYVQLFGLTTDKEYYYSSGYYGDTDPCEFNPDQMKPYATLRGFESLPKNDQVQNVPQTCTSVVILFQARMNLDTFGHKLKMCRYAKSFHNFSHQNYNLDVCSEGWIKIKNHKV